MRNQIIALTDLDGDGYVSQEEFLQLANGKNLPGFNRRRRRALRELLKQTVEFIVSSNLNPDFDFVFFQQSAGKIQNNSMGRQIKMPNQRGISRRAM